MAHLATRLGLTALAAAAVTGVLSLAVTWWAGPIDGAVEGCIGPAGPPRERVAAEGKGPLESCLARLTDEGYRQRLVYQPANRFWTLQWRESALFVLAAGALAAAGLWWVRVRLG